ncbi:hypothetical protein SAMN05444678_11696 [Sphingomonas sp. YR710]|nr:hypothetical protein SAMN05444678_11696 [Sphingomonas sp. YR710]
MLVHFFQINHIFSKSIRDGYFSRGDVVHSVKIGDCHLGPFSQNAASFHYIFEALIMPIAFFIQTKKQ